MMSVAINDPFPKDTLPFDIKHLPDIFIEKAERELNESKENLIQGLKEMKKIAHAHKTTCDLEFVDDFLVQFLRQRKYEANKASRQLINFIQFRINYSFKFGSVDTNSFFLHPSGKFFTVLPHRCQDGCTVILYEIGKWDPEKVSVEDFTRLSITICCQAIRQPITQINGFKIIIDFTGTTFKHIKYCTPHHLYPLCCGATDCFPGRFKEIHIVSDSLAMKTCWMLAKGFLSQKLKRRFFFHPTAEGVLEFFPSSILPVQYGGVLKDFHMTEWLEYANEQQGKFPLIGQHNFS